MQEMTVPGGREQTKMKMAMVTILVVGLALSGCAGMTDTQQRTLTGGAMALLAHFHAPVTISLVKDLVLGPLLVGMMGGMAAGMAHKPAAASQ